MYGFHLKLTHKYEILFKNPFYSIMDTAIFVVATLTSVIATVYMALQGHINYLKEHWSEYRCNPIFMPMAGLVGQNVSKNFMSCVSRNFTDVAGLVVDPIEAEFSVVTESISEISTSLDSMRGMFSNVRGGFMGILGTVFGKIHNLMSTTQYLMIRIRTMMARVAGVFFSLIYVFQTGLDTGESVMNGPIGKTVSFLCFDPKTSVQKFDKTLVHMEDIQLGDQLKDGGHVISIYTLAGTGVPMYDLCGIRVTGSHKVKFGKKFVHVSDHPLAKRVPGVSKLVCLNTTTHRIPIGSFQFLDFMETDDVLFRYFSNSYLEQLYNGKRMEHNYDKMLPECAITGIHGYVKVPMRDGPAKKIADVRVGDVLDNKEMVYGVVKHYIRRGETASVDESIGMLPGTWVYKDGQIHIAKSVGLAHHEESPYTAYQLIVSSSMFPLVNDSHKRVYVLDELANIDTEYHRTRDAMVCTGRFRGKEIVV